MARLTKISANTGHRVVVIDDDATGDAVVAVDGPETTADAVPDVRRCSPVADDDVPSAAVPDAGPYVADLAIAPGAVRVDGATGPSLGE